MRVDRRRCSTGADVLVVVEDVVGVVLGLDLGESPVDVIALGLSNAGAVVVGIKEVDVDAVGAVRLESSEELSVLGFKELLSDSGNLVVIEWPERVREILPPDIKMLHFVFINSSTRSIQENKYGKD